MSRRIGDGVARPLSVEIVVDGRPVPAYLGETLSAALSCAGFQRLRSSPRNGEPRGAFCLMGVCQECVVMVDGRPVNSCMEPVRAGMVVELGGA
jgi:D-hydroxyproline dehydrogenase subunit gamma